MPSKKTKKALRQFKSTLLSNSGGSSRKSRRSKTDAGVRVPTPGSLGRKLK